MKARCEDESLQRRALPAFFAALALSIALQWLGGAYRAEWSESSDESAHFVTGLAVLDYLTQGGFPPPAEFLLRYRQHYPNVELGHWPPGFYLAQAAWTIPFGVSRASLLVLMAMLNAAFLMGLFLLIGRFVSPGYGWLAMLFAATVPATQIAARSVMTETFMALTTLAAVWALRCYFVRLHWRFSAQFGTLASLALLTKGTGVLLAPLPLAAVLSGQRRLLLRRDFWLPAVVVLVLCLPWYLLVPGALHERVAWLGGLMFDANRLPDTFSFWIHNLGIPAFLLALAGIAATIPNLRDASSDPIWRLALFTCAAATVFRMVVAVWEPRHLLTTFPFLLLFAAAGLSRLDLRVTFLKSAKGAASTASGVSDDLAPHSVVRVFLNRSFRPAGALLFAAALAWNVWRTPPKEHLGLDAVAERLTGDSKLANAEVLVLSDLRGEGAFIAEVARRESRPGRVMLRGNDVLASLSFLGTEYRGKFTTPEEAMTFLAARPRLIVVIDQPSLPPAHTDLVRRAIGENPHRWRRIDSFPRIGGGGHIELWALLPAG